MAKVLAGPDFTPGRLAVILTADEDDRTQANTPSLHDDHFLLTIVANVA
jgi:hypothetical protein